MRRLCHWVLGLVLVGSALGAELKVFPAVKGENLHGEEIVFPAALASNTCSVVIVAFLRSQQEIINPWLPGLVDLTKSERGFEFFELPTLKPMNRFTRWVIYRGMRSGIPDDKPRSRTVTLYLDKSKFNRALGVTSEDTVYFFVVDQAGRIRWRCSGGFTEAKFEELKMQVRRVLQAETTGK